MRQHRTLLITTCADEKLLAKQRTATADVAFLELEDGVLADQKAEARARCLDALQNWDYQGKERWVRINQITTLDGMRDLMELVPGRPDALIPGKLRSKDEITVADYILSRREEELGLPAGEIKLCPMVESGPAVINLKEIITASPRMIGVCLGTEDLSVDVGIMRTEEERELEWVRGHVVMTCHALGVECFDVASVKLREPKALWQEARRVYHMGYDGKMCISPTQVDVIHDAFTPEPEKIAWAQKIIKAAAEAEQQGTSVFAVDGRMVDYPFIEQAKQILRRAGQDA
ncbi:MAG: CoA ester lyase [Cellvibrionales bacterium]|nr:CoA ester lyase [Cellvibrionales bacterium]